MPYKPPRPCQETRCPNNAETGRAYCKTHRQQTAAIYELSRDKNLKKKYNLKAWRALSELKLRKNPLCERHLARGEVVAAALTHHKKEVSKGGAIIVSLNELESLCKACHNLEHKRGFNKRPGQGEHKKK